MNDYEIALLVAAIFWFVFQLIIVAGLLLG